MNILNERYYKLIGKERRDFRVEVSRKCGWTSDVTFYRKLNDTIPLRILEIEAIKKMK